jgi:dihydrofolate reductase
MRKMIVTEYVTVDGVMEDPGGAEKSRYGGWSFQFWNEEAGKYKNDELLASGALLLGRKTYEGFAKAWPSIKDEYGFADRMNSIPKYVVSKTLEKAEWRNSTVIRGNVAEEVAKLKQQPGRDILVVGSAKLLRTLMEHNLVDEYRLMVHPVVLGGGKRLFQEGMEKKALKLLDAKTFATGIVVLTYQSAKTGK